MKLDGAALWQRVKHFFDFSAKRREIYQKWDQLAENGDKEARYKLLMLYREESEEYYPLSFKWTIAVANEGEDCGVMLQAAEMYEAGYGAPRNEEKALLWFERALSLHILQGKNSPLSLEASNYIQQRIQEIRGKLSEEPR